MFLVAGAAYKFRKMRASRASAATAVKVQPIGAPTITVLAERVDDGAPALEEGTALSQDHRMGTTPYRVSSAI